eukprot:jgi/Chlat1/6957/Chrsp52S06643
MASLLSSSPVRLLLPAAPLRLRRPARRSTLSAPVAATSGQSRRRSHSLLPSLGRRELSLRLLLLAGAGALLAGAGSRSEGFAAAAATMGFTKSQVAEVLEKAEWPEKYPLTADDFRRFDETSDFQFYNTPRFVTHIDDSAIAAITQWYTENFPPSNTPGTAVLDLCSSWISHFPPGYKQERIVGLGMNEDELKRNKVLTEYTVKDLNADPSLPYDDNSFDVVVNAVSVDYLTKPLEVFKEINRVLKPGGLAAMSFSNRCFPTKAIAIWTGTSDLDHIWIVGSYYHYAGGFQKPQAKDITLRAGRGDPMYVVYGRKLW